MKHDLFGKGDKPVIPGEVLQKFRARTEDLGDGHMQWTGSLSHGNRSPFLYYRRRQVTAGSVAFILRTGRWPDGVLQRVCDVPYCVGLRCIEDGRERDRLRRQLAALGWKKKR